MLNIILENYLKLFFILTPFFILSTFLSMTATWNEKEKKHLAVRVTIAILCITLVIMFAGNAIFKLFGITIDSFRIGTGALLFLSAVGLIKGGEENTACPKNDDIAVVPLAMPVAVGPATVGTLLVMGIELKTAETKIMGILSLFFAVITLGILLYGAGYIEKLLRNRGLTILSKLTGLILAAMSAQMIMGGIKGFFNL